MKIQRSQNVAIAIGLCLAAFGCSSPAPTASSGPDGAPSSTQDEVLVVGELVLQDGAHLGGEVRVRSLHVVRGAVVIVDEDLVLDAAETIVIEGELRAIDVAIDGGRADAPRIELYAGTSIVIAATGAIRGGRGRSFEGLDPRVTTGLAGGAGSDIYLSARCVVMHGILEAGDGGCGGGGAEGGRGGSISQISDVNAPIHNALAAAWPTKADAYAKGGIGGTGGQSVDGFAQRRGGGGEGGGVTWQPYSTD